MELDFIHFSTYGTKRGCDSYDVLNLTDQHPALIATKLSYGLLIVFCRYYSVNEVVWCFPPGKTPNNFVNSVQSVFYVGRRLLEDEKVHPLPV